VAKIPTEHQKTRIPLVVPTSNGALASLAALSDSDGCIVDGSEEDHLTIRNLVLGFRLICPKRACTFQVDLRFMYMNSWILSWIPLKVSLRENRVDVMAMSDQLSFLLGAWGCHSWAESQRGRITLQSTS
jgi:hypothetical protein